MSGVGCLSKIPLPDVDPLPKIHVNGLGFLLGLSMSGVALSVSRWLLPCLTLVLF